jgi:hypothetical protein
MNAFLNAMRERTPLVGSMVTCVGSDVVEEQDAEEWGLAEDLALRVVGSRGD